MDDLVDEQQIVTGVTQRAIDRLIGLAESALRKKWANIRNQSEGAFTAYILGKSRYCRQIRNNLYDTDSANLLDIYIKNSFITGNHSDRLSRKKKSELQLVSELTSRAKFKDARDHPAVIIRGVAGAGKSLFTRKTFLDLSHSDSKFIPLFVELRDLARTDSVNIVKFIHDDISSFSDKINIDQIYDGLNLGLFFIILDGIDEIPKKYQRDAENQITSLAKKYPLCPFIVSGRPSESMRGWSDFKIFDIAPLTKERAILVVERLKFNKRVKEGFIEAIRDSLYYSHTDFVENPLLLTVMLLTFNEFGRISPDKHEFLDDVFNTLWSKHDAKKEGYVRQHFSGLSKRDFVNFVGAFAVSTYSKEAFDLTEQQIDSHIEYACSATNIVESTEDLKKDLTISTSIVIQDGSRYRFSHRYFQEYFCALYVSGLSDELSFEAIEEFSKRYDTDFVVKLLVSINTEKFERFWVVKKYKELKIDLTKMDSVEYYRIIMDSNSWDESIHSPKVRSAALFFDVLRTVYDFNPKLTDIYPTFDLTLDGDQLGTLGSKFANPFQTDFENQKKLYNDIITKYETIIDRRKVLFGLK